MPDIPKIIKTKKETKEKHREHNHFPMGKTTYYYIEEDWRENNVQSKNKNR